MVESRERTVRLYCTWRRVLEGTLSGMEEDKMMGWSSRQKVNKPSGYIGFGHTTDYRPSQDQSRCRDQFGEIVGNYCSWLVYMIGTSNHLFERTYAQKSLDTATIMQLPVAPDTGRRKQNYVATESPGTPKTTVSR